MNESVPSTVHFFSSRGISATFSTKEQDFCGKSFWDSGERSDLSEEELLLLYRKLLLVQDPTIFSKNIVILLLRTCEPSGRPYISIKSPCTNCCFLSIENMRSNSHAPAKCTGYRKLHFSCVETHVLALTVVQSFDMSVDGLRIIIDVISPICYSTNLYGKRN